MNTTCVHTDGIYSPTWQSIAIELTVVVLFVAIALNAYGQGRRWFFTLLSGALTGFVAEAFLVSVDEPRYVYGLHLFWAHMCDVPLCIGLGWGLVFYIATWTAQRLAARSTRRGSGFRVSILASSFVAGALGVSLDISLDPVANAHGFWTWQTWKDGVCSINPPDMPWTMFGVPYDNFVAWMLGIAVYGFWVRLLFHRINGKTDRNDGPGPGLTQNLMPGAAARRSNLIHDALVPVVAGVLAAGVFIAVRLVAGRVYGWLNAGHSSHMHAGEARIFAVIFLVGLVITWLAVIHGSRSEEPNWPVLVTASYFHAISFGLLVTTTAENVGALAPLLVIIPMNCVGSMLAYLWPSLDAVLAGIRSRKRRGQATARDYWAPPIIRRTLSSYGGTKVRALVAEPENERELLGILAYAREGGRAVTFRGSGLAFDSQSLNDDLVISLKHFSKIELHEKTGEVVVGCAATWGDILTATLGAGLVPYTMVTSSAATAGGTLSAHSISRFSPSVGREGQHVKSFRLLTPAGKIMNCSRDDLPGTDEHALFNAVIGGLGYVGAVLEITHELLRLPFEHAAVHTTFTLVEGLEKTASMLSSQTGVRFNRLITPFVQQVCDQCARRAANVPPVAMSAVVNLRGGAWGLLAESRYVEGTRLKPSVFHSPASLMHTVLQFSAMFPWLRYLGYKLTYRRYAGSPKEYVDPLHGYTFFEDGNRRVRKAMHWLGLPARLLQQTFMIECDVSDSTLALDKLTNFLREADHQFEKNRVDPALIDILYVGRDTRDFLLSSSRGLDAFAVTFTFERLFKTFEREIVTMKALSDVCGKLNGRVHLVKHVHADRATIAGMYGQALMNLQALRTRHSGAVLSNEFSSRALPGI